MLERQRRRRKMKLNTNDKLILYGLYKQAAFGDAPKRSVSFTREGLAKQTSWNRVSQHVNDDALEEAFLYMEKALALVKKESPPTTVQASTPLKGAGSARVSPSTPATAAAVSPTSTKSTRQSWSMRSPSKRAVTNQKTASNNSSNRRGSFLSRQQQRSSSKLPNSRLHHLTRTRRGDGSKKKNLTPEERLLQAAAEDDEATLLLLLQPKTGADHQSSSQLLLDAKDEFGQSALHIAADRGCLLAARVLLDNGANVNGTDPDGISVLQAAVIGGHALLCQELLERGADPDKADQDGDTPRLCAADDGSVTLLHLFGILDDEDEEETDKDIEEDDEDDSDGSLEGEDEYLGGSAAEESGVFSWPTVFSEGDNAVEPVVDRVPTAFRKRRSLPPAAVAAAAP